MLTRGTKHEGKPMKNFGHGTMQARRGILCFCVSVSLWLICSVSAATTETAASGFDVRTTFPLSLEQLSAPQTTRASLDKLMKKLTVDYMQTAFSGAITSETLWEDAFWTVKLLGVRSDFARSGVRRALRESNRHSLD